MTNIAQQKLALQKLAATSAPIDKALDLIDDAQRELDVMSRNEEQQDLFLEVDAMLLALVSIQSDLQSVLDTYNDQED
tara:strand:- start:299 stop:532 length:234 start_codon:yes stop_codon:yes gene_type:complete